MPSKRISGNATSRVGVRNALLPRSSRISMQTQEPEMNHATNTATPARKSLPSLALTFNLSVCGSGVEEEKTRNGILCTPSVNPPRKQRMSFRQRSVTYVKSFLRAFTREKSYPTCFKFRFVSSPQVQATPRYDRLNQTLFCPLICILA